MALRDEGTLSVTNHAAQNKQMARLGVLSGSWSGRRHDDEEAGNRPVRAPENARGGACRRAYSHTWLRARGPGRPKLLASGLVRKPRADAAAARLPARADIL